jgi:small subunit ribosomal protein S2
LLANIGGIINLRLPIGAVVIIDVRKEQAAVKEASVMGIPIVGLVDTNSDPSLIDYVIPGNDDSIKSISLVIDYLGQEIKRGKELATHKAAEEAAARQDAASAEISIETVAISPTLESEEENVAREQARARKLRESIKAKKGDTRRPAGRSRRPASR